MTSVGFSGWLIADRGSSRRRRARRRAVRVSRRPCRRRWWLWRARDPRREPYPTDELEPPVQRHGDEQQRQVRERAQIQPPGSRSRRAREEDKRQADEHRAERQRRDQVEGAEEPREHR